MAVLDPSLRSYIQQYPSLSGPDENSNLKAFTEIRKGVVMKTGTVQREIEKQLHVNLALTQRQETIAGQILRSVGISDIAIKQATHDFGWRFKHIPESCDSVLCLGIGTGEELAFLRAKAPGAHIVVMDYVKKVWPGLLETLNAEFIQCDLVAELSTHRRQYDVIFSNHTLEHQFDPDLVLRLICSRLTVGSLLVSGMPLDADPSIPLLHEVEERCSHPSDLHIIDMGLIDPGHPWKSNATDLYETLQSNGYANIQILQRSDVPYRTPLAEKSAASDQFKRLLQAISVCTFSLLRRSIKVLFRSHVPLVIRRVISSLERRLPFGASRLKNRYAPDIVFVAQRFD